MSTVLFEKHEPKPGPKTGFVLRAYQAEDSEAVYRHWDHGDLHVLCVHATGLGKSVLIADLMARKPAGGRGLVVVDNTDLSMDLFRTIKKHTGQQPGILSGEFKENLDADILVATKQCLCAGDKFVNLDITEFSTLCIDECEAALANEYVLMVQSFIDRNPGLRICGLTATPLPANNRAISDLFPYAAKEPGILYRDLQWAYLHGWLVKPTQGVMRCSMDFTTLKVRRNEAGEKDYSDKDIAQLMLRQDERQWLELAGGIYQISKGYTAIVVCPNSTEVADKLAGYIEGHARDDGESGVAFSIHRKLGRRRSWDLMQRFKRGEFPIAVSVRMFEKGFDYDKVNMVVMCRRTKSLRLYCLDSETEVLTPSGWSRGRFLKRGDVVAAFNPENDSVSWEPVEEHVCRTLYEDENMVAACGPSVDIRITDSHRMVYSVRRTRKYAWQPWKITTAKELLKLGSFAIPVSGFQEAPGIPLADDEIRFVGLVMTDGNYNPHNNQISLYQSTGSPVFKKFEMTLAGCGFKFGRTETTLDSNLSHRNAAAARFTVSRGNPRGRDKHLRGWDSLWPYIPKATGSWKPWEDATAAQWEVFLEAMHWGDGIKSTDASWTQKSYHLCIGNIDNAEAIQSISVRRGWRANLTCQIVGRKKPIYILHLKQMPRMTLSGTREDRTSLKVVPHDERELVWCIQVPSGAFITRRNGKVCVVGNTQIAGRATRPLKGIRQAMLDEPDDKARMAIIANSKKPSCVIVDCVGVNDDAKDIIGVIDILGRGVRDDIKERVRRMMLDRAREQEAGNPRPDEDEPAGMDVGDDAREAVKQDREERERKERERRAAVSAKVDYSFELNRIGNKGLKPGQHRAYRRGDASAAQVRLLIAYGVTGATALQYGKRQAGAVIHKLKSNNADFNWRRVIDYEKEWGTVI